MDPSCALLFRNNLAAVAAENLSIHRVLKALEVVTDRDVLGISRKTILTLIDLTTFYEATYM